MKRNLNTGMLFSLLALLLSACGGDTGSGVYSTDSGQNGSTSGMVIQNGYLVVLTDANNVSTYDLSDPQRPLLRSSEYLNRVETLSVYGPDLVMLGARDGSYLLQIRSDGTLSELSFARHARSCDPVIASNGRMYVTVRAGNRCGDEGEDRLLIYDVSSPDNTWLLGVLPLPQPQGLALSGTMLYVCTPAGLQEVDVSDPLQPQAGNLYPQLNCNDLIVQGNETVITGDDRISLATLDQLATPSAVIGSGH